MEEEGSFDRRSGGMHTKAWWPVGAIFWLLLCSVLAENQVQTEVGERDVLLDLYRATGGPLWLNHSNWGDGLPCRNEWYGVQCDLLSYPVITFLYVHRRSLCCPWALHLSLLWVDRSVVTGSMEQSPLLSLP